MVPVAALPSLISATCWVDRVPTGTCPNGRLVGFQTSDGTWPVPVSAAETAEPVAGTTFSVPVREPPAAGWNWTPITHGFVGLIPPVQPLVRISNSRGLLEPGVTVVVQVASSVKLNGAEAIPTGTAPKSCR